MTPLIAQNPYFKEFQVLRQQSWVQRTESLKQRRQRLLRLRKAVLNYEEELITAIAKDFNKPAFEVLLTELYPLRSEIRMALKHLRRWSRPRRRSSGLLFPLAKAWVQYEAKGLVLIMAPWNYPSSLLLIPLVSALAAGNTALLKPSEVSSHTALVLEKLIQSEFSPQEVAVIKGGPEVAEKLLELPFDHIFFTGSPGIGKVVMAKAAQNLTPITLELGGKSPTVIDISADVAKAAEKIVWGKTMNAGQTCVAPDYVFVHHSVKNQFLEAFTHSLKSQWQDQNISRVINERHFARLKTLLAEAVSKGGKLLVGNAPDRLNLWSPTLIEITDSAAESKLMQEEIFGPILPLKTYNSLDEVISYINSHEKPLSLYLFSRDQESINRILSSTSSGSVCINDVIVQNGVHDLPFGGVGNSGFGSCHGESGFRTFSHEKAIMKQGPFSQMYHAFYPPYRDWQIKLLRLFLKWTGH